MRTMDGSRFRHEGKLVWFALGALTVAVVSGAGSRAGNGKGKAVPRTAEAAVAAVSPVADTSIQPATSLPPLFSDYVAVAPRGGSRAHKAGTPRPAPVLPATVPGSPPPEKREEGSETGPARGGAPQLRFAVVEPLAGPFSAAPEVEALRRRLLESELKAAMLRKTLTDRHPDMRAALEEADNARRLFEEEVARQAAGGSSS